MGDRDGKVEPLTIQNIPGRLAPRFDAHTTELTPVGVFITEQGMASGLPLVDFIFEDPTGRRFAYTTSGRMMLLVATAIKAINLRVHGKEEP